VKQKLSDTLVIFGLLALPYEMYKLLGVYGLLLAIAFLLATVKVTKLKH
jgi:hypothetical protein